MSHDKPDSTENSELDACVRLGELSTLFGAVEDVVAQAVCRAPAILPDQLRRLDDILAQMRSQAQRMRASQLGLRLIQGGRTP